MGLWDFLFNRKKKEKQKDEVEKLVTSSQSKGGIYRSTPPSRGISPISRPVDYGSDSPWIAQQSKCVSDNTPSNEGSWGHSNCSSHSPSTPSHHSNCTSHTDSTSHSNCSSGHSSCSSGDSGGSSCGSSCGGGCGGGD